MKIILAIALSLITSQLYAQKMYVYKVSRVIDGDTLEIETTNESQLIKDLGLQIRVLGIDTPEKKGKCQKEKDLAQKATLLIKNLVENKEVAISNVSWDKFGGRIDANVFINGVNINDELFKRNLAIPYFGEKKEKDWCK